MITKRAYVREQDARGFQKGDRVRCTRSAKSGEQGWQNSWVEEMNVAVGTSGTVIEVFDTGVGVLFLEVDGEFCYPHFVLEKVEENSNE